MHIRFGESLRQHNAANDWVGVEINEVVSDDLVCSSTCATKVSTGLVME